MADLLFFDRVIFWVNVAYIASVCLSLLTGFLAIYLSYQRSAAADAEYRKIQTEYVQQAAAANERAFAAAHAAERAQSEAAATAAASEKVRKENLDLAMALEREKRMRMEMEERLARQPSGNLQVKAGAPRMLTLDQEEALASAMSRFRGVHASLIELSDPEAGPLARDITRLLQSAGWNIFVSRFGALVPPQNGLVCTHDGKNPAAAELVKTLRSFGLTVYERNGTEGQFEILVGLRPPSDR